MPACHLFRVVRHRGGGHRHAAAQASEQAGALISLPGLRLLPRLESAAPEKYRPFEAAFLSPICYTSRPPFFRLIF